MTQGETPRRIPVRIPLFAAMLAAVVAGLWWYSRPEAVPVTVRKVERGTVEATVANTRAGSVKACRRARLAPSSGGQISRLAVKKGERVEAGQILLELWDKDLAAQEKQARQQLGAAEARAREACAIAEQSRREAERSRQLRTKGFIAEARLDQTLAEAAARTASCEAARSAIGQAREAIAATRAGLERTVLRAPFAGIVAEVTGELGEFTTPSPPGIPTPPAIDLIDDSCLYVSAPIDEVDAPHVAAGMSGRITLDAMKDRHFAGTVRRVAPYVLDVEKQARTVEVEVQFADPEIARGLLAGYSADVEIVHARRDQVLRIPTPAMQEGGKVLVLRDGMLEERTVRIGLSNWEYSEILGGLNEGDMVVTSLDREEVKAGIRATTEAAAGKTK